MRTTIDLPNDLFRQVKSRAALRGETLKEFVQSAIEKEISIEAPASFFPRETSAHQVQATEITFAHQRRN